MPPPPLSPPPGCGGHGGYHRPLFSFHLLLLLHQLPSLPLHQKDSNLPWPLARRGRWVTPSMRREGPRVAWRWLLCRFRPPEPVGHPCVDAACHVGDATDASGADGPPDIPGWMQLCWSPIPNPTPRQGRKWLLRILAFPRPGLSAFPRPGLSLTALRGKQSKTHRTARVVSSWPACTCVPLCSVSHAGGRRRTTRPRTCHA